MNGRKPIFIHYVRDMGRARKFYESVFDVSPSFSSSGWSTLNFDSIELALHILSGQMDEAPLPHAGLNLEVDLIEEMQARIEQNGGKMIELREPDRNVVAKFFSSIGELLSGEEERGEITYSFERSQAPPADPLLEYISLDVSESEPGGYTLTVEVEDLSSGQKGRREVPLTLTD